MCSDLQHAFCHVKDSVIKHKWLLTAGMLWIFVSSFWTVYNQENMYKFYGLSACAADYMIAQQEVFYSGLTIFPFVFFFVIKCKQNSLNTQYILRYQSRKRVLKNQFVESVLYAAISALLLVGAITVVGWSVSGKLINWDAMDSVFLGQTGNTIKVNFLTVAVVIWLMYIVKFNILFAVVDIAMWYPKTLFLVWIVLLIPLGIEAHQYGNIFFNLFTIQQTTWMLPEKWIALIIFGVIIFGLEYMAGKIIVKKRDIWG